MASRLKEEEKIEKAIRSLSRKPPNRRCVNCNSLGPQYVCLNFWTFVCTRCSGIHREFTHRVKSVSMSKFTSQEVSNLENGGNEHGREIYFKDWDSQRQPLPDSSNVDRLREFIKMVYVDKRFSGERPVSRARGGDGEETYNSRRSEARPTYRADSRSPPYEGRYDEWPPGWRSGAGYDDRRADERSTRFDEKRSPGHFETDKNRYGTSYNDNRRYDERSCYENRDRPSHEGRYNESLDRRSEDRFANERANRNYGGSSPPPVRPVREILGDDVPPLRVENHGSQANGGREIDKSQISQDGQGQRFGSSSSFGSVDGNVPAVASVKREDSTSLIDFSVEPDPPAPSEQQPDPFGLTAAVQPSAAVSSSTGWATFDMFSTAEVAGSAAPTTSVGAFISAPSPPAVLTHGPPGAFPNPPSQINGNSQWAAQWTAPPVFATVQANANSWSSLIGPPIPASSQPWNAFHVNPSETNVLSTPQMPTIQGAQNVSSLANAATQALPAQPSGRSEIPEDFFGGSHLNVQYNGPQHQSMGGMGILAGNYNQPKKSQNPFDLPVDSSVGPPGGEFPSLTSLQVALPAMNTGPISVPGSGLGTYGPQWSQSNTMGMQQYPPVLLPSLPSASGLFIGHQSPTAMPQTMQVSLGSSLGSMPGSFLNASKQANQSFFPVSSFSHLPSQNSFGGGADSMFTAQGAGAWFSYSNAAGPGGVGNASSTDSFMPGSLGQQSLFLGPLSSMPGAGSLFPTQPPQPGQLVVSHSSSGSLSSMTAHDAQFSVQAPSPFQTQSSLGPVGNPFG